MPLVCQHCLAYSAMNTDVQQKLPHEHCKHDNNLDDTKTGYVEKYLLDVCGCSGQEILASTVNKPCDQITKVNFHKMSPHFYLSGLNVPVPTLFAGTGIKPFIPDRACYHPLERNCIQLK